MECDELLVVKQEMEKVGCEVRQVMSPIEAAGVLISMYPGVQLDIERRALSYALLVLFENADLVRCTR